MATTAAEDQEYHKCQIELYDKMRAMGGNIICQELYKGFLDLFATTHKEKVMVQAHAFAKEVFSKENELKKCRQSLLIHNMDMWVKADRKTVWYILVDRATAATHKLTYGMGQWKIGSLPLQSI